MRKTALMQSKILCKEEYFQKLDDFRVPYPRQKEKKTLPRSDHVVYYVSTSVLLELRPYIPNWSENREFLESRMEPIREFQNKTHHVNGCIQLAYLKEEGLVCYEGNHRLRALTEKVPVVLVDVLWDANAEKVKAEFDAINEAVTVSSIHIDTTYKTNDLGKRIARFIRELVKDKSYFAEKRDCNRPKIHREVFEERVAKLYKEFVQEERIADIGELFAAIKFLNDSFINESRKMVRIGKVTPLKTENTIEKAKKANFMLNCAAEFLWIDDVEWALENYQENKETTRDGYLG